MFINEKNTLEGQLPLISAPVPGVFYYNKYVAQGILTSLAE